MPIDLKKIHQSRLNRETRLDKPFENFYEIFQQCHTAGDALLEGKITSELMPIFERSVIITAVTAIEVYYRDMLDAIFKYCSPEYFEKSLSTLHPDKYNIHDMIDVYRNHIHPLELVVSSQSFQSTAKIEKVFSNFVKKGFWSTVLDQQARIKDDPDTVAKWSSEDLDDLNSTFELRHELVHNPARKAFFDEKTLISLIGSAHMVFGSDLVLSRAMVENKDPTLDNE